MDKPKDLEDIVTICLKKVWSDEVESAGDELTTIIVRKAVSNGFADLKVAKGGHHFPIDADTLIAGASLLAALVQIFFQIQDVEKKKGDDQLYEKLKNRALKEISEKKSDEIVKVVIRECRKVTIVKKYKPK